MPNARHTLRISLQPAANANQLLVLARHFLTGPQKPWLTTANHSSPNQIRHRYGGVELGVTIDEHHETGRGLLVPPLWILGNDNDVIGE
jgi:hypothetical protein